MATNTEAVSGVHTFFLYGEESIYGTATAVTTQLGIITGHKPGVNNNLTLRRGFKGTATTAREAVKSTPGPLDIRFTVDWDVINWTFMRFLLGNSSATTTAITTYLPSDNLLSFTAAHNIDNPGAATDREETYPGTVIDSCTIRCAVGDPVTASADVLSKTLTYESTLSNAVGIPPQEVYNFAGADIEFPNSSSLSNIIDSMEITITNNAVLLYGCNSRLAQKAYGRNLEYSIRFTLKYLDDTLLNAALGAATPIATGGPTETSITAKFVSGTREIELRFTGVQIDWNQDATHAELLSEDITATARNLTAVENWT